VVLAGPGGEDHLDVVELPDLDAAARLGREWASPDGVALPSPAAPSFDRFRDYRHRAEAFAAAVGRPPPTAGRSS
jgi:UDP-N-acetylmuramoylalanine--D-glutamate ligase